MFNNALRSGILHGVPLGEHGDKMCHLQFADDLLVMTAGGEEDFRIIKLILYLFEGLSGLKVNSSKTCLYSARRNCEPPPHLATTMHCTAGTLPLVYLGVPISGGRPRRQDWETLIGKIRNRLATWKSKLLSLGGRLTLLNSVLFAIPTYWMSIFKLPCWVVNCIEKIRKDFLWSGPDAHQSKMRLVGWTRLCRSREQGGWGILNLTTFNNALLGKWWWKIINERQWCGELVLKTNYFQNFPSWNLYHKHCARRSFFWNGILRVLPAFRKTSPRWFGTGPLLCFGLITGLMGGHRQIFGLTFFM